MVVDREFTAVPALITVAAAIIVSSPDIVVPSDAPIVSVVTVTTTVVRTVAVPGPPGGIVWVIWRIVRVVIVRGIPGVGVIAQVEIIK